MLSRLSIRLRLTVIFTLVMAVLLAAMSAFVYVRVRATLTASIDQTLRGQAGEIQDRMARNSPRIFESDDPGEPTVGALFDDQGHLLRSTPGVAPSLLPSDQLVRAQHTTSVDSRQSLPGLRGDWRVLAGPVQLGSRPAVVAVASSLAPRDAALDHLLAQLALSAPLALLIASGAGYILAAAALRPVDQLRRKAAQISAQTPGDRLPIPAARDEIARLSKTLNEMLERIESALTHERRLVGDASHELRTPLAMLKAELELALSRTRTVEELEQAVRSAAQETDRLAELAEDLLLLARSDQGQVPLQREHLYLLSLLEAVRARFAADAEQQGREITVHCLPGLATHADPGRLTQAVSNLVENALHYGGGTVDLAASHSNGKLEIHVTDQGPGFPPGFLDRAFERFSRADAARVGQGSGLGLAIVELIAVSHGGKADARNRVGEGADVWLAIPADQARAETTRDASSHGVCDDQLGRARRDS